MDTEQKSSWIQLILAVAAYGTYLVLLLGQVGDGPLHETPYVWPLVWTIVGSIGASIVLHIFFAPRLVKKDQRDREIGRFGEAMGSAFVVIGALGAMVLALFDLDGFWIANLVYLCFVLSAILSNIAKIVAYRSGIPRW
jgi:hypothetical protein